MKLGRFSAIHAPTQRIYKRAVVALPSTPTPVLNLDADNYLAVPTNGSTVAGAGAYPITVQNTNSRMSWNAANGGVFRVTSAATNSTDFMSVGPDYSSGTQAFTVAMAYKWNGVTAGRLLNANSASPDFLMGLWGAPAARMDIAFNGSSFIGSNSTAADTAWHFIWFTWNGSNVTNSYIATTTAPTGTYGTGSANSGFNGLRLFGRFASSTVISEPVDADVGFVKVWNSELTLAQIQAEHAAYKTRYGVTVLWDSVDASGGNVYANTAESWIEITQVSSGSTGSALNLYNAVNTGVLVLGTTVKLVTDGAPPTTSYLVLTSGFTYDAGLGGGGGGWRANATTTSGTAIPSQGLSAVFFLS